MSGALALEGFRVSAGLPAGPLSLREKVETTRSIPKTFVSRCFNRLGPTTVLRLGS